MARTLTYQFVSNAQIHPGETHIEILPPVFLPGITLPFEMKGSSAIRSYTSIRILISECITPMVPCGIHFAPFSQTFSTRLTSIPMGLPT